MLQQCMDVIKRDHKNINELFEDVDKLLKPRQFISNKKQDIFEFCDKSLSCFDLIERLHEILSVHDDITINIEKDFQIVTVMCKDCLGGMQYLKLKSVQNANYIACDHSLPGLENLKSQFTGVEQAINVFKECLKDLSEYFETMADLDECCWIIDPIVPTSKDNFRRIIIGDNVSILITVDYKSSRDMPHISVLGPTAMVDALSHKVHQYTDRWNTDLNLTLNLLNMLDLTEFVTKPAIDDHTTDEPMEVECGICISSRDDSGCLPNIVCENTKCGQNFHSACLYQWLSTVAGNIQIFDTIHGQCPNCFTSISCGVVELT